MAVLAAVADFATEAAAHGHPEAGLADVARRGAVHARACLAAQVAETLLPYVRRARAIHPARVVAIDRVSRNGRDEAGVPRNGGCQREKEERAFHHVAAGEAVGKTGGDHHEEDFLPEAPNRVAESVDQTKKCVGRGTDCKT